MPVKLWAHFLNTSFQHKLLLEGSRLIKDSLRGNLWLFQPGFSGEASGGFVGGFVGGSVGGSV